MKKRLFFIIFGLNFINVGLTNGYYNFSDVFQNCSVVKEVYKTPSDLKNYIYSDFTNKVFFYQTNSLDYYLDISGNIQKIGNQKDFGVVENFQISDNLKDYILNIEYSEERNDTRSYLYYNGKMEVIISGFVVFDENGIPFYLTTDYNNNGATSCVFNGTEKKCYDREVFNIDKRNNHFGIVYEKKDGDNYKIVVNIDGKDVYSYDNPRREGPEDYYIGKFMVSSFSISPNGDYGLMLEEDPLNESQRINTGYIVIKNGIILQEENALAIEDSMGGIFKKGKENSDFFYSSQTKQYRDFYFVSNNQGGYDLYYTIGKGLFKTIDYFPKENNDKCLYYTMNKKDFENINIQNYTYLKDNTISAMYNCNSKIYINEKPFYLELFPYVNGKMNVEIILKNEVKLQQNGQIPLKKAPGVKIWGIENNVGLGEDVTSLIYLKYLGRKTEKVIDNNITYYHNDVLSFLNLKYGFLDFQKGILNDYLMYKGKEINMGNFKSFENPLFFNNGNKINFNSYIVNGKNSISKNNYICDFNSSFFGEELNKKNNSTKYELSSAENQILTKFSIKINGFPQDKKDIFIVTIKQLLNKYSYGTKNYEILNKLIELIK